MTSTLYFTEALSTGGGRDGHVRTADGALDLDLAAPAELGGSGHGVNPEQLFAAGYAACFHSALRSVARSEGIQLGETTVGVRIELRSPERGSVELAGAIEVTIPELPAGKAQELADKAHQGCPYSKATRDNIEVTVTVTDD